jgi:hypothetical protein
MTATTKKAIEAARLAARAAFLAAQVGDTRWADYRQAEQALTDARAIGWVEDHPDHLTTVRAGVDCSALARMRLGKKSERRYAAGFQWNYLGTAVRRILTTGGSNVK